MAKKENKVKKEKRKYLKEKREKEN